MIFTFVFVYLLSFLWSLLVKHFAAKDHTKVAFIGTGVIATAMARGTATIHKFTEGYAYGLDTKATQAFADEIKATCGYTVKVCATAEEACRSADVIFTQTPGNKQVLELGWLKPHATIIASGSDQPTKVSSSYKVVVVYPSICCFIHQFFLFLAHCTTERITF